MSWLAMFVGKRENVWSFIFKYLETCYGSQKKKNIDDCKYE